MSHLHTPTRLQLERIIPNAGFVRYITMPGDKTVGNKTSHIVQTYNYNTGLLNVFASTNEKEADIHYHYEIACLQESLDENGDYVTKYLSL